MGRPHFQNFFHSTGGCERDGQAFEHALALTLACSGKLYLTHSQDDKTRVSVRRTLARWGRIPDESARDAVRRLNISVSKQRVSSYDLANSVVKQVGERKPDLVVMAAEPRLGWRRLLGRAISDSVVERTRTPSLLFPPRANDFVSPQGEIELPNILLALSPLHKAERCLAVTERLLKSLRQPGTVHEIFLGGPNQRSSQRPRLPEGWQWDSQTLTGDFAATTLQQARDKQVGLIVMARIESSSFLEEFSGGVLDRVLAESPCPLLVVPS